ncbi:Por secretion system C-terminal sorting domain-containing protein [Flavobacterium swingsii]|jgi:hypothetical protein|uniref:Por secretion system C-terminal sorting domain-containing protein n=1 Tax=Flavobacterium swingsii TaxID=498292 RepID=A0A1I0ZBH3_9FLAO|nr:T9SS type A sorting domain-containing protein [Flavobacterium swingsii]SFB22975.1 Por secretion system C-terminal sorting domain-containing protein [Flavobacterium swingsii]
MKKKLLLILGMTIGFTSISIAQFTTGVVTLTGTRTLRIDTSPTIATMTITGSDTSWLGIGFGGSTMSTVSDMFIWNDTADRDFTPSGMQSQPSPDAGQSWTIVSDNASGGTRTVVATRPLVSSGDFTFVNNTSNINIIYNEGLSETLAYHGAFSERGSRILTRTALGLEEFSLNATQIYPNPSNGNFMVKTKTGLDKINVYSQVGAFVKTIMVNNLNVVEVSIKDLPPGVYLLELLNTSDKSWKKIIVN